MATVMSAKRHLSDKSKYVPRRSGMMEFEPVTVDEARAALDEIDAAMASLIRPEYWLKVRRKPLATDRALTGRSMKWLAELPQDLRPLVTMQRYARVINSIVDAWPNADDRDEVFENLLNDRRRGRRGFPIDVERELSALCLFASMLPR
jgi:hypothetical protein